MMRPKSSSRGHHQRQRILQSALDLFAKQGYRFTGVRDIARKAGVNVSMVNYYFGSKNKLYLYLLEEYLNQLKEVLAAHPAMAAKRPTKKKLYEKFTQDLIYQSIFHRKKFFKYHLLLQQELVFAQYTCAPILKKYHPILIQPLVDWLNWGLKMGWVGSTIAPELKILVLVGFLDHVFLMSVNRLPLSQVASEAICKETKLVEAMMKLVAV